MNVMEEIFRIRSCTEGGVMRWWFPLEAKQHCNWLQLHYSDNDWSRLCVLRCSCVTKPNLMASSVRLRSNSEPINNDNKARITVARYQLSYTRNVKKQATISGHYFNHFRQHRFMYMSIGKTKQLKF